MKTLLRKLWVEEEGQTLVEYALIIALISIVCIAAMSFLGNKVDNTYSEVGGSLK